MCAGVRSIGEELTLKQSQIRRRVFVPFAVGLGILLTAVAAGFYYYHSKHLRDLVSTRSKMVDTVFRDELNDDAHTMRGAIGFVEKDSHLREAYLAGDRERLLNAALPIFEELRSSSQITHFYFLDLQRVCFLRVHNPTRHGDVIKRFTMAQAALCARDVVRKEIYETDAFRKRGLIHLCGNSHLDLVYLWTHAEFVRKIGRTHATALRLMEQYPHYKFSQSHPLREFSRHGAFENLHRGGVFGEHVSEGA